MKELNEFQMRYIFMLKVVCKKTFGKYKKLVIYVIKNGERYHTEAVQLKSCQCLVRNSDIKIVFKN